MNWLQKISQQQQVGMLTKDNWAQIRSILDQADANLPYAAQNAISSFVGHEPKSRDKDDYLGFGIMHPDALEDAFSQNPSPTGKQIQEQINATFKPIKEQLKSLLGNTVKLFRSQWEHSGGVRNVLSWTMNEKFARAHADAKPVKRITDQEIMQAVNEFQAKGETTFGKHRYIDRGDQGIEGLTLADDYGEEQFDYWVDNLEEHLRWEQDWLNELADKAEMNYKNRILIKDTPLDQVVWATDRANQMEFIVRNY